MFATKVSPICQSSYLIVRCCHIPTTVTQKTLLALGSSVMSFANPRRHDMVAVCADTTSACALNRLRERMANDYMGAKILQDKPVINTHTVDFGMLSTLPENTLGRSYVNFLKSNRVSPDSRYPVQFIDDPELAYVMQRYRETHDLNHTLLDMPITLLGEVCVKVVEAIQTGFPMCISAALLGPLKLKSEERRTFIDEHLHVAIRNGRQAEQLLNVYFEHHWESDIYDLRKKYGIITSNSYCVSSVHNYRK